MDYVTQKRVALIIEFKCKDNLVQSLKKAKSDLERKNLETKIRLNEKHSFINSYEKILAAAALRSGQLQGVILYKVEMKDNQEDLVEIMRWPEETERERKLK